MNCALSAGFKNNAKRKKMVEVDSGDYDSTGTGNW